MYPRQVVLCVEETIKRSYCKKHVHAYQRRILVRRSEIHEELRIGGSESRLPRRTAIVTKIIGAEIEQYCVRGELRIVVERARVADNRASAVAHGRREKMSISKWETKIKITEIHI